MNTGSLNECRMAFEEWAMNSEGNAWFRSSDTKDGYVDGVTNVAFLSWQAAWNTRHSSPMGESLVERIAKAILDNDHSSESCKAQNEMDCYIIMARGAIAAMHGIPEADFSSVSLGGTPVSLPQSSGYPVTKDERYKRGFDDGYDFAASSSQPGSRYWTRKFIASYEAAKAAAPLTLEKLAQLKKKCVDTVPEDNEEMMKRLNASKFKAPATEQPVDKPRQLSCDEMCDLEDQYGCQIGTRQAVQPVGIPVDSETVGAWPDNIIAQRHEVSCKWWLMYLDDRQATLCQETLMRPIVREAVDLWQPIESAPRDGTYVLVEQEGVFEPSVNVCCFDSEWSEDGWWMCCDGKNTELPLHGPEPTFWMPIPRGNRRRGRVDDAKLNVVAIEVYDDEIRYDGKTIWRGAARYKNPEEVDAIISAYRKSNVIEAMS